MKFIFEVKVKPEYSEQDYIDTWLEASALIQKQPGARGTRLHRKIDEPGTFLAIACWDSKESRDNAMKRLDQADPTVLQILHRHLEIADLRIIGNFNDAEWIVEL